MCSFFRVDWPSTAVAQQGTWPLLLSLGLLSSSLASILGLQSGSPLKPFFHAFRRHYGTTWLRSICHYAVWRCFLLTTTEYPELRSRSVNCSGSFVMAGHFGFQTAKHWVSILEYTCKDLKKIWKLDSFVLHLKQIFPLLAFCCLDYWRRKGGDTITLIALVCFEITVKRVGFFCTS